MKIYKKIMFLMMSLFSIAAIDHVVLASSEPLMSVHFIDVGEGLSILVQSDGENLLYDGGDQSHSDLVVSYLQENDVQNIDYMVLSHYDEDHIAGLLDCLEVFQVDQIMAPDYVHDTDLYMSFVDTAAEKGLSIQHPSVGESFDFGTGNFTVLAPDGLQSNNSNENSLVIKLENQENSFLLTGDAEEASEQSIISTGMNLDCDVLSVGHHGSASSTGWDLLEATTPDYAVISCGAENQYGHPSEEMMSRLSDMSIPVFRTDKQGTIIATSDGAMITWNTQPCNDYSSGISQEDTDSIDAPAPASEETSDADQEESVENTVWLSATGSKYHRVPDCGRMNPDTARQISESDAIAQGYEACSKCY